MHSPTWPSGREVRLRDTGATGTAYPVFRDCHVHLGLVDPARLPAGGIGAVVDLGWSPDIVDLGGPLDVVYAGRFLAAPGGYPSDRSWAPVGSVTGVASPDDATNCVVDQLFLGAGVIKVTLNAEAGPVLDPPTLAAVVSAAHAASRQVVAHAQGTGMVERALVAEVDVLAHTPWTERLPDDIVAEAARRQAWISTLDIHGYGEPTADRVRAIDNLARFRDAGGRVLYGTDLGNGPLPVGLNAREITALTHAGLTDEEIIEAVTSDWPAPVEGAGDRVTFVPGERGPLTEWLAGASVVPVEDLEGLA
ncbi:MAG TPA: hypothetical protein VGJ41_10705 [Nocardioides sp.]